MVAAAFRPPDSAVDTTSKDQAAVCVLVPATAAPDAATLSAPAPRTHKVLLILYCITASPECFRQQDQRRHRQRKMAQVGNEIGKGPDFFCSRWEMRKWQESGTKKGEVR